MDKPLIKASEQKLKKLFVFCMGIHKPALVMIVPAISPEKIRGCLPCIGLASTEEG